MVTSSRLNVYFLEKKMTFFLVFVQSIEYFMFHYDDVSRLKKDVNSKNNHHIFTYLSYSTTLQFILFVKFYVFIKKHIFLIPICISSEFLCLYCFMRCSAYFVFTTRMYTRNNNDRVLREEACKSTWTYLKISPILTNQKIIPPVNRGAVGSHLNRKTKAIIFLPVHHSYKHIKIQWYVPRKFYYFLISV